MPQKIDWESQIGRRLKLRDLHVFSVVVQRGSMAKAAAQLGVSQPTISEIIADLEQVMRVRLLDRGPRGIEPTIYGEALLKRGKVAFDELKEGIKDIEYLADPTVGEVRIACPESLASAILPPIVLRFSRENPGVVLHVDAAVTTTLDVPALRERTVDILLARVGGPVTSENDDLNVELLFDDELVVVAGTGSRWAGRRKIDPAELVNAPWVMTPPGLATTLLAEAFGAEGLGMPKIQLVTFSMLLRAQMLATDEFITVMPKSALALNGDRFAMEVLRVNLPVRPWPVAIVSLKNRTLSPVALRFIDHLRAFAKSMTAEPRREIGTTRRQRRRRNR